MINGGNIQFQINGGAGGLVGVSGFIPTFQKWYHFAITRSGNTFRFYVDGVQYGTEQTSSAAAPAVDGSLYIGTEQPVSFSYLEGRIDELEIVHRALSGTEIQAIYNAGRAGKCKSFTMYVSNKNDNTIEQFDVEGNDLGVFTSSGLSGPAGLAFDRAGYLYVANSTNHTIHKFSAEGIDLGTFASTGLNQPIGLAFDRFGDLYASNSGSNTVERFSSTGMDMGVFANIGLSGPYGIAFDNSAVGANYNGNLYVVNQGNNTIRKFNTAGADLGNFATGLSTPKGIVFDTNGIAFVSNAAAHTVSKFDIIGNSSLFTGTGLNMPIGLAFDSNGNLYAANSGDNSVAKIDLAGLPSIFASTSLNQPAFVALKPISPLVPVLSGNVAAHPAVGHFTIGGDALPNATVYIQASSSLQSGFNTIGTTIADQTGAFQFEDTNAGSVRFYRGTYP